MKKTLSPKSFKLKLKLFLTRIFDSKKYDTPCNICGNKIFFRGPNSRLSTTNQYPWCINCLSLERHRGLRLLWEKFPKDFLKSKIALQFSKEPTVDSEWFNKHVVSVYGGENSLDIQNIDFKNEVFDIVICNQVIEHVPDDKKAIKELLRVLKKDGFVQMSVPYPMQLAKTIDWGYPKESDHGHYRNYGKDINLLLDELVGKGCWKEIVVTDPVTIAQDYVYILCRSKNALLSILEQFKVSY
ncbi:class I SAM-dependent methyltransferase [Lutibacter sp.]